MTSWEEDFNELYLHPLKMALKKIKHKTLWSEPLGVNLRAYTGDRMTGLESKLASVQYFADRANEKELQKIAAEYPALTNGFISTTMRLQREYDDKVRLAGKPNLTLAEGEVFKERYFDSFRCWLDKRI